MFTIFGNAVHTRYNELAANELYVTDVDNLFEQYLAAFPPGTNPIHKTRTEYDCQCCKQFIKRLGVLVAIQDNRTVSIWDNLDVPEPYKTVADYLSQVVRVAKIKTVFRSKEPRYGLEYNYGENNVRHDHFYGEVKPRHFSKEPDTQRGEEEAIFQVCQRGLQQIRHSDLVEVLGLIDENQLYRGAEHKPAIRGFKKLLEDYTAAENKDVFVWDSLSNRRHARFRNTVIGTLFVELAEGKDLDAAIDSYGKKVDPLNYKRTTSTITQKMVEDAVQKLTDLGLGGAIYRRYAKMSDVRVTDVLWVSNDTRAKMKDGIALLLEGSVKKTAPTADKAIPITIDEFIKTVVPTAETLEAFVENRHLGNFVSLTGSDGPERLFKWDNNFAWSYDGDVTDSVKQRVKAAGGNVDAKLRVSLSWFNYDDLDIHAITPSGTHVFYANKLDILDVDMNAGGARSRTPVENLAFNRLENGVYKVYVNQFNRRETIDFGFAIEVEFEGQLQQYSYDKAMPNKSDVECFKLTVKDGRLVKLETQLKGGTSSQDKWGVKTQSLVPVKAMMFSPNHWNGEQVGARHVIFALENCKNPEATRGIYNEFLKNDLTKHRKVFEVLGAKTKCAFSEEQVSGIGFTAARNDSVVIVSNGRSYNITF
jgi:hypothetical protein